jgi:excisionase family DNA binding protein
LGFSLSPSFLSILEAPMPTHTRISGETFDYDASPELAAFITRAALAVADPAVTVADLVELLYGEENPLLVRGVIPGRGYVTAEILADPAYRVILDLLDRKRVAAGTLDVAASDAAHTVTVSEAARRLGISTGAVRQAIAAGRIPALKRAGQYWLRDEAIASYRVSTRGPSSTRVPTLRVRLGTEGDAVLQLRSDGALSARAEGALQVGELAEWTWATVKTARKDLGSLRVFELRPGPTENEIRVGGLEVVGRFEVAQTFNARKAAEEAWKARAR